MNLPFLSSLRSLIRPVQAVISDVAKLEQKIFETEINKSYWLNKNSIDTSSIAKLHELSKLKDYGYSTYIWKFGKSGLNLDELKISLKDIFKAENLKNITIDISEVRGLSASKSPIENYHSMQQFVEKECLRFFKVNENDLQSNLAHKQIRIIHSEHTTDHFRVYGWSDKLFLSNGGGSHHFASAQYIAEKLSKPVPITGDLSLNYIDEKGLLSFIQKYSSLLIPESDFCYLSDNFEHSGLDFIFYQAPFLPAGIVILFYKNHTIPDSLDSLLKNRFTDFNIELIKFFDFQKSNTTFQKFKD